VAPTSRSSCSKIDLQFSTRPGETIGDATRRLEELLDLRLEVDTLRKAIESELPRGRLPIGPDDPEGEATVRYTRWYYRNRMNRELINEIAKVDEENEQLVSYGINTAERVLSLTPFRWVPGETESVAQPR